MQLNTTKFLVRQPGNLARSQRGRPKMGPVTAAYGEPLRESVKLTQTSHSEPVSKTKDFLKFGLAGTLLGGAASAVLISCAAAGTVTCAPLVLLGSALAVGVTTGALGASEMTERASKSRHRDEPAPWGQARTPSSGMESAELSRWMKPVAVLSFPE